MAKAMTKSKIIAAVAEKAGISKKQTALVLETLAQMAYKEAKNGFGLLLDSARAEPVTVHTHGRPVGVVVASEEFRRLKVLAIAKAQKRRKKEKR